MDKSTATEVNPFESEAEGDLIMAQQGGGGVKRVRDLGLAFLQRIEDSMGEAVATQMLKEVEQSEERMANLHGPISNVARALQAVH